MNQWKKSAPADSAAAIQLTMGDEMGATYWRPKWHDENHAKIAYNAHIIQRNVWGIKYWPRFNPRLTGVSAEHHWLGGGGRITPPHSNSQTNDRSETGEAALERSRRGGSEALLFFFKWLRVRSRSGQRSKLSVSAFWFSEPPTWLKQAQTRPKHSQRLDEDTVWV